MSSAKRSLHLFLVASRAARSGGSIGARTEKGRFDRMNQWFKLSKWESQVVGRSNCKILGNFSTHCNHLQ